MASIRLNEREDSPAAAKRSSPRGVAWLFALALLISAPAGAAPSAGTPAGGAGMPALVVLVRHAEKAANPKDDPPLTKAGMERARALVEALKDTKVTAIITSDAQRTRETAAPLAEALGLTPKVVALGHAGAPAHAEAVAAELRRQAGGVVVVVDHSDTIPLIITALGGPRVGEVSPKAYADLFVLTPGSSGARLVRARYGAPDGGP
jgi:phosphohistidine phosphatase SixA